MSKRKVDQVDQPRISEGSRSGKLVKSERDALLPSFHIRLTYPKIDNGSMDQWISGRGVPDFVDVMKEKYPKGGRVSLEKGKGGIEHFQCHILCAPRKRRLTVRNHLLEHYPTLTFPLADYCEGVRKEWASRAYCKKDATHIAGPWEWGILNEDEENMTLKIKDLPTAYKFQDQIMEMYRGPCPTFHTTVDWFYDPIGQIGKTMVGRMLTLREGFYLLGGKAANMKSEAAKHPARGYFVNLTRTREGYFSYEALEAVSDAYYTDTFGTDKSGMIVRKASWICVVSNGMPIMENMSAGRIKVWYFDESSKLFVNTPPAA